MSNKPFPKPPPAEPLPEEVWLKQTDRAEVGREPFFCGRDDEYDVFCNAVGSLSSGRVGGGTMVFQGAPGVGKSALMLECMEAVRRHSTPEDPWVATSIRPETLMSSVDVVMDLVIAVNEESNRLSKMASNEIVQKLNKLLQLGEKLYRELVERGGGVAGFTVGGKLEAGSRSDMNMTSARVFRNAAPLLKSFIWWCLWMKLRTPQWWTPPKV